MPGLKRLFSGVLSLACAALAATSPAAADPIADFYKGKTLRMFVGFDPGGGYDLYARVFGQHFTRFMPGNPVVVVQNMPGAGSIVAAKHLFSIAPQDGTSFGCLAETLILDNLLAGATRDFEASQLSYVGRFVDSVNLGLGVPGARFQNWDDALKMELIGGASGLASTSYLLATALAKHAGAKFKMVTGYKGSNDMLLAAERKEIDFVGSMVLSAVMTSNPAWILERKAPILYQGGLKRHALLPHVPALPELGKTDDDKAVLTAIASTSDIGRAINTTPNVPPERLAALRKAFDEMVADKGFLAEMEKRKVLIQALNGAEVDKVAQLTAKLPRHVLDMTKALLDSAK